MSKADEVYERFLSAKLAMIYDEEMHLFGTLRGDCGSPIEEIMLALLLQMDVHGHTPSFFTIGDDDGLEVVLELKPGAPLNAVQTDMFKHAPLIACAQAPFERYRTDFMLWMSFDGEPAHVMCIECDGHDYHERTKKQAAHDRNRDREMTAAGIEVMRFTGSELYSAPEQMFMQLHRHLTRKANKQEMAAVERGNAE